MATLTDGNFGQSVSKDLLVEQSVNMIGVDKFSQVFFWGMDHWPCTIVCSLVRRSGHAALGCNGKMLQCSCFSCALLTFQRFTVMLSILSKLQMLSATPPHFILCILPKVESYIRDAHGLSYSRSFITWHEITKSYSSPEIFLASWYFMDFTNPITIVTCKTLCKDRMSIQSSAWFRSLGKPVLQIMCW